MFLEVHIIWCVCVVCEMTFLSSPYAVIPNVFSKEFRREEKYRISNKKITEEHSFAELDLSDSWNITVGFLSIKGLLRESSFVWLIEWWKWCAISMSCCLLLNVRNTYFLKTTKTAARSRFTEK